MLLAGCLTALSWCSPTESQSLGLLSNFELNFELLWLLFVLCVCHPLMDHHCACVQRVKPSCNFWSVILLTNPGAIVDGVSVVNDTANLFASKLNSWLSNTHPGLSVNAFDSSLFAFQLSKVNMSVNDVLSALESLKPGKLTLINVIQSEECYSCYCWVCCLFLYHYSSTWI